MSLKHRQHIPNAHTIEIVPRTVGVATDLGDEFVDAVEFPLIADTMQKSHTQCVTIEFGVKVQQMRLNGWLQLVAKRRSDADVRHTPTPLAVDQGRRCVYAELWNDAI